jgi:hypothetical protein
VPGIYFGHYLYQDHNKALFLESVPVSSIGTPFSEILRSVAFQIRSYTIGVQYGISGTDLKTGIGVQ